MRVAITPVGKPRQTRSDVWKQRPAVMRYRAFADELRLKHPQELPTSVRLVFHVEMPKSWSKKKRLEMDGRPHQQRPDVDNLAKSVLDSLLEEDCTVYRCVIEKYWAVEPGIDIEPYG